MFIFAFVLLLLANLIQGGTSGRWSIEALTTQPLAKAILEAEPWDELPLRLLVFGGGDPSSQHRAALALTNDRRRDGAGDCMALWYDAAAAASDPQGVHLALGLVSALGDFLAKHATCLSIVGELTLVVAGAAAAGAEGLEAALRPLAEARSLLSSKGRSHEMTQILGRTFTVPASVTVVILHDAPGLVFDDLSSAREALKEALPEPIRQVWDCHSKCWNQINTSSPQTQRICHFFDKSPKCFPFH